VARHSLTNNSLEISSRGDSERQHAFRKGPHTRSKSLRNTGCWVVWFDCLCNSLTIFKQVWNLLCNNQAVWNTCLRSVVPRHQFIVDSHNVRMFFSKCHIEQRIKICRGNLYSYIGRYRNYGKSLPPSNKQKIIAKQAALDVFFMIFAKRLNLRKLILSYMDTVSCCTTCCCANLFHLVWGPYDRSHPSLLTVASKCRRSAEKVQHS